MTRRWTACPCSLVVVGIAICTGCDNFGGRVALSGNVLLKGQPLENGTITFYPVESNTQSGAPIENGKFKIVREKGLVPGKYRVSISSPDGETPADPNRS